MIKQIIESKSVEIHFQPIVSIRTKKIYAFEALTRCTYMENFIPPNELFELAKKEDLIIELDELTRTMAIEKFKEYHLKNNDLVLFLNFESTMINKYEENNNRNSFVKKINSLKIPSKNFVLEVKEDEITNTKALKKFCSTYKEMGFSIALDDFGTGSSTFDRINLIRPDIIKIDRSLFTDIKTNQINKEIVKAISKMSHNLGIRVLGEGVEDEHAICLGLKSTINLFQGFYFAKPTSQISDDDINTIVKKIITIGKDFKARNIAGINKKREVISKYDLIANEMFNKINSLEDSHKILEDEFYKHQDIEAIYLIDSLSSKQINDTMVSKNINDKFKPTKCGDEHYLKEYYYITLESKQGIFLSPKYISYATGNICKTFAKRFSLGNKSCILCLDIVVEGK